MFKLHSNWWGIEKVHQCTSAHRHCDRIVRIWNLEFLSAIAVRQALATADEIWNRLPQYMKYRKKHL